MKHYFYSGIFILFCLLSVPVDSLSNNSSPAAYGIGARKSSEISLTGRFPYKRYFPVDKIRVSQNDNFLNISFSDDLEYDFTIQIIDENNTVCYETQIDKSQKECTVCTDILQSDHQYMIKLIPFAQGYVYGYFTK